MNETLRIERLADNGKAIARAADGTVVFVNSAAPGDLVRASIYAKRSNFYEADIAELLEPSADRVTPRCCYFDECGGCDWQHLNYQAQLRAKQQIVVDSLIRIGKIDVEQVAALVCPVLPSTNQFHYRNKISLGAKFDENSRLVLGFRKKNTHLFVSPETCILLPKAIASVPKALRGALGFALAKSDRGLHNVSVRHSTRTRQTEVALWTEPGSFNRSRVANTVSSALKTTSIVRVIAKHDKLHDIKKVEALSGNGCWKEKLAGIQYLTSAPSFFQINSDTAEQLIAKLLDTIISKDDDSLKIADLFAGGGTFSLPLARAGHRVSAVECAGTSVRDLLRNSEINQLEVDVLGGDVSRILPQLTKMDVLVTDPPRSGLAENSVLAIAQARPKQLIYISCNPATWARDVMRLGQKGFSLTSVVPVDQFPQTPHIELLSSFRSTT